jgi:hypothetical protein
MKTLVTVLVSVIPLSLPPAASFSADKYVPTSGEVLYGSWTNKDLEPARIVTKPDGTIEWYASLSDTAVLMGGKAEIFSKWTDSEGNVWYQVFAGPAPGIRSCVLPK